MRRGVGLGSLATHDEQRGRERIGAGAARGGHAHGRLPRHRLAGPRVEHMADAPPVHDQRALALHAGRERARAEPHADGGAIAVERVRDPRRAGRGAKQLAAGVQHDVADAARRERRGRAIEREALGDAAQVQLRAAEFESCCALRHATMTDARAGHGERRRIGHAALAAKVPRAHERFDRGIECAVGRSREGERRVDDRGERLRR